MQCPYCGNEDTKIIDSRSMERKKRRRRECGKCGRRFTTNAIKKRPVNIERVNKIAEDVENHFANAMISQTTSEEIGNMTLELLKDVDDVAYIRFASVYKAFTSVEGFITAISELDRKHK